MDTQSFSDQPYSKQTVIAMHVHQGRPTVTHHLTMYACSLQQEHLTSSFEALFNSACQMQRSRNHNDVCVCPTGSTSRMCASCESVELRHDATVEFDCGW